jgi:hypothetical protein
MWFGSPLMTASQMVILDEVVEVRLSSISSAM